MLGTILSRDLFAPDRWGIPDAAVARLGDDLYAFWERFRHCFRTRTRDTSHNAYIYLRGQLTMEDARNFANIARRINGHADDGQALQQFMSDSPWLSPSVYRQIQREIQARPILRTGGVLILDECPDEKAGEQSAGASRQHHGRLGKVELSQVGVYLAYAHPATGTWALVDGELFLPQGWFRDDHAALRWGLGIPAERQFATKPELGLQMIQRVRAHGLPFEFVACDDLYGRKRAFRAALDAEGIAYAAEVPADTLVYLQPPQVGLPPPRHPSGRKPTRLKVLSQDKLLEARALLRHPQTVWQRVQVRHIERGVLEADFAVRRVWTLTEEKHVRGEWLVIRRDRDGRLTFVLLNAPAETPTSQLIERSCQRYFTERTFQSLALSEAKGMGKQNWVGMISKRKNIGRGNITRR